MVCSEGEEPGEDRPELVLAARGGMQTDVFVDLPRGAQPEGVRERQYGCLNAPEGLQGDPADAILEVCMGAGCIVGVEEGLYMDQGQCVGSAREG